jgi:hypothetical protein
MKDFNWKDWLAEYNQNLIGHFDFTESSTFVEPDITPELIGSGWLGYRGAFETELTQLETRLGIQLPPSYRAFLATSNGFRQPGRIVPRLYSTEEIDWLKVKDPEAIDGWILGATLEAAFYGPVPSIPDEEYFIYDKKQDSSNLRPEHLRTALQISARETVGTAIYLLNPQVITAEGEWEAWFFAHWLPGATRYRSFLDLMQSEHGSLLEEINSGKVE